MSDLMLLGVLQMPIEMVMSSELSTLQYVQRGHEAAARIKADAVLIEQQAARIAELEARTPIGWEYYEEGELVKTYDSAEKAAHAKQMFGGVVLPIYAAPVADSAMAKDAGRYRWLIKLFTGYDFDWMPTDENSNDGKSVAVFDVGREFRGGRDFTAALDAAIATSGEKEG